jgi:hypothetical protein
LERVDSEVERDRNYEGLGWKEGLAQHQLRDAQLEAGQVATTSESLVSAFVATERALPELGRDPEVSAVPTGMGEHVEPGPEVGAEPGAELGAELGAGPGAELATRRRNSPVEMVVHQVENAPTEEPRSVPSEASTTMGRASQRPELVIGVLLGVETQKNYAVSWGPLAVETIEDQ